MCRRSPTIMIMSHLWAVSSVFWWRCCDENVYVFWALVNWSLEAECYRGESVSDAQVPEVEAVFCVVEEFLKREFHVSKTLIHKVKYYQREKRKATITQCIP